MRYLLDSSAWLAHLLGEPGAELLNALLDDPQVEISISALSIVEVFTRLKALGQQESWGEVWEMYLPLFSAILPATEAVAQRAILFRGALPQRIPTIDCMIAATAVVYELTLVHRDPHLAALPAQLVHQMQLPDK